MCQICAAAGFDGRLSSKETDPEYGLTTSQMATLGLGKSHGLLMSNGEPDLVSLLRALYSQRSHRA